MSDWAAGVKQGIRHGTLSPFSLGQPCGESLVGTAGTTAAWPVANRALFMPVTVTTPITVTQLSIYNGEVAGEVDAGLYSYKPEVGAVSLVRLVHNGKVAMAGKNVAQVFNIADTAITPGIYFLGFVCSTATTATFRRIASGVGFTQAAGIVQSALGSAELPETITPAKPEAGYVPAMIMTTLTEF